MVTDDDRNLVRRGRHGRALRKLGFGELDDGGNWTPFEAPPRDWTAFTNWAAVVTPILLIALAAWVWL